MRISYVGELGWELHIPHDQSLSVWDALWESGQAFEMIAAGSGAMDSLRVEKGYRPWGADLHTEYNLYQAGLRWKARTNEDGGFIGRKATLAAQEKGIKKRLCCLNIDDPAATLFGYEPVYSNDSCISHLTTANYGCTIGKQVAFSYLPQAYSTLGTSLGLAYFNQRYEATVVSAPL
jgi:glycine cleavage system aminomethyltransferase T